MPLATYVWIDGTGHLRCKYRSFSTGVMPPSWTFTEKGMPDVQLVPIRLIKDPLSSDLADVIVLCECLSATEGTPMPYNTRASAVKVFDENRNVNALFCITQEYVLFDAITQHPYKWAEYFNETSIPKQAGTYCGLGTTHVIGRDIALQHYKACHAAGLAVVSMHSGRMPAQWAFKIGPLPNVAISDELWLARFLLEMICEKAGLKPMLHPKPKRKFNGSGCLVTYSNDQTRSPDGMTQIMLILQTLSTHHATDIEHFGEGNRHRLLGDGKNDASSYSEFTFGVGDKCASVRLKSNRGYFEDRRPGANCDPYIVTSTIHRAAVQM